MTQAPPPLLTTCLDPAAVRRRDKSLRDRECHFSEVLAGGGTASESIEAVAHAPKGVDQDKLERGLGKSEEGRVN